MSKKRSKKGKILSFCDSCKYETVEIVKMGGIICGRCFGIKRLHK